jgi:hypothetical protein
VAASGSCPRAKPRSSRISDDPVMRLASLHNRKLFGEGPATVSLRWHSRTDAADSMSKGFTTSYRIALLASLVLAMFAGLEARLVWLHVIDRDELLRSVDEARRQLIVDNARRGDILDAHGALLATSRSIIVLGVDPQFTRPEDAAKWPQLAALIGVPVQEVERIFSTKTRPAVPRRPT